MKKIGLLVFAGMMVGVHTEGYGVWFPDADNKIGTWPSEELHRGSFNINSNFWNELESSVASFQKGFKLVPAQYDLELGGEVASLKGTIEADKLYEIQPLATYEKDLRFYIYRRDNQPSRFIVKKGGRFSTVDLNSDIVKYLKEYKVGTLTPDGYAERGVGAIEGSAISRILAVLATFKAAGLAPEILAKFKDGIKAEVGVSSFKDYQENVLEVLLRKMDASVRERDALDNALVAEIRADLQNWTVRADLIRSSVKDYAIKEKFKMARKTRPDFRRESGLVSLA